VWTDLLEENGLAVVARDSQHVEVHHRTRSALYRVVHAKRRMKPSDIGTPPERNSILVAEALSRAAATAARDLGWSAVPDSGPAWINFKGHVIRLREDEAEPSSRNVPAARRGRPGFGIFTVLRTMLSLDVGSTQQELAEQAQVTQARVSQALHVLRERHLVERGAAGWVVADRTAAIRWWLDEYPGPGGISKHWFGLDPVIQQAKRAHDMLAREHASPVVSGDVAADLVAPWRTPRHALLYAKHGVDLSAAELTTTGAQEATLTLVVPADPGVWPIVPHRFEIEGVGDISRASALQVLWDLRHASGPDSADAARAWLEWMLNDWATP
jgi:hypothetical protein